jgi:phosphatidate cytidylyltransferase
MSNFWQRIITAAIAIPILYVIFRVGGLVFLLFIMALVLTGQIEYQRLLQSRSLPFARGSGIILSLLIAAAAYTGYMEFSLMFTLSVLLVFIFNLRKTSEESAIIRGGATLFGIVYLGWLLCHAVLLRNIDTRGAIEYYAENAQELMGAYFAGHKFGKRKIAPSVSPGKTVEGTLGGVVVCVISGLVVNYGFGSPLSSDWTILFALFVSAAAIFGDLVESAIKRGVGIKDSGAIVPGHGGVLDRFDSLIFVFPVSYYFVLVYYSMQGVAVG